MPPHDWFHEVWVPELSRFASTSTLQVSSSM